MEGKKGDLLGMKMGRVPRAATGRVRRSYRLAAVPSAAIIVVVDYRTHYAAYIALFKFGHGGGREEGSVVGDGEDACRVRL